LRSGERRSPGTPRPVHLRMSRAFRLSPQTFAMGSELERIHWRDRHVSRGRHLDGALSCRVGAVHSICLVRLASKRRLLGEGLRSVSTHRTEQSSDAFRVSDALSQYGAWRDLIDGTGASVPHIVRFGKAWLRGGESAGQPASGRFRGTVRWPDDRGGGPAGATDTCAKRMQRAALSYRGVGSTGLGGRGTNLRDIDFGGRSSGQLLTQTTAQNN